MPAVYTCDICGADDATENYDGEILCTYHKAERDLGLLKREYKEKHQWVKDVWLTQLRDMRLEIELLKRIVKENKPPE